MAKLFNVHEKVAYRYVQQGILDECLVKLGDNPTLRFNAIKVQQAIDRGRFGKRKLLKK